MDGGENPGPIERAYRSAHWRVYRPVWHLWGQGHEGWVPDGGATVQPAPITFSTVPMGEPRQGHSASRIPSIQ